ncbi:hypothetical protein NL676_020940 [Syzygium grande]|nr:hypothetical protein NL676_020940 [Syzygium grande]
MHITARAGRIRTAELLLDCSSIVDMANDMGNTTLHEAVKNRHYELTHLFLSRGSTSVYRENKESKCPLYLAVETGDSKNLMLLMEAVDGHEVRSWMKGMSPVHGAMIHQRIAGIENADILQALLEVILDKQLAAEANCRGDTALHVAARAGRIRSAELLLGCGRIVDMANDAGNTALHEAVKKDDSELTRLFLSRGSRAVYPKNKESKCPLYLAVETGNSEILKLLMEAMDENEVPWSRMQGMSPVHGAVMHQRLGQ